MEEFIIVVDIEASGPSPGLNALLSIGACTLGENQKTFYIELQPDKKDFEPEAMAINQLSLDALSEEGISPKKAMQAFSNWIAEVTPGNCKPLFVAFNAPFDWMFINDYFHRYLGTNPFGYKALDIKAFFMGLYGTDWENTSHLKISQFYRKETEFTHHALQDALDEAKLFRIMLEESQNKNKRR
jgi:DNA polymerase III epsilon subunit-like protein